MNDWRYRVWRVWHDLGMWCTWLTVPYHVISTKLWDWCHYQHGLGAHLGLRPRRWRDVWAGEIYRQRNGDE